MEVFSNIPKFFISSFVRRNIRVLFFLLFLSQCYLLHSSPPKEVPSHLFNEFTQNGEVAINYWYFDDSYPPTHPIVYETKVVEKYVKNALAKTTKYYGKTDLWLYEAFEKYISHIRDRKVAVLGSKTPWYESIVLAYGGHPVTIEYNKLLSQHPKIRTMTVEEYDNSPEKFDALVSISSFEHDGLGRYGDPIDPNGDLKAMQKAKKMLHSNGVLFLAVPVGPDLLIWNAHRVYGPKRLWKLIEGWKIVDVFGFSEKDFQNNKDFRRHIHQPVFVLTPE